MERLQKVLAQAGIASRRKAEELILAGKVRVNGETVTTLGTKVDPAKDKISVEGKQVKGEEKKIYLLLNKPAGYVTTVRDPQGRSKVTDLLKGVKQRVYPVGRLDFETEGLLILTNDGDLAYALTHPRHGVEKTYLALVAGVPEYGKIRQMRQGLRLRDGLTSPAKVRTISVIDGSALLEIRISEGRNRQVRRMCECIGHPVIKLQRTAIGSITLEGLKPGAYRELTPAEVRVLMGQGGQAPKSALRNVSKKADPAQTGREKPGTSQNPGQKPKGKP